MRGPPSFFSHRKGADFLRNPTPSSVLGLIWNTKKTFSTWTMKVQDRFATKEYRERDGHTWRRLARQGRPRDGRDAKKVEISEHMCSGIRLRGNVGWKFRRPVAFCTVTCFLRAAAIIYSSINIWSEGDLFKKRSGTVFYVAKLPVFLTVASDLLVDGA